MISARIRAAYAAALLFGATVAGGFALLALGDGRPVARAAAPPAAPAGYAGGATCAQCHEAEAKAWARSHHARAMETAGPKTVLGDFANANLTHHGVTTRFVREGSDYVIETQGPKGETKRYKVAYTFGFEPLQQYVVRLGKGRLQVPGVAWDSRPKSQGGQRWFHLYAGEKIAPGDVLHWTQPSHNLNRMCAECHVTGYRKGYDAKTGAYATRWSETNVTCEACHGPGARHVAWAKVKPDKRAALKSKGLVRTLRAPARSGWLFGAGKAIAHRTDSAGGKAQVELCGACHARRSGLGGPVGPQVPLTQSHRPALIAPPLYFADGQIHDEVYVYGSFLQSRMHAAGVTCTDCHEPHSMRLRAEGNALCAACHLPARYDTPKHNFHKANQKPKTAGKKGDGTRCVSCHMPSRLYMTVDARRDHSFRVPRPDLSPQTGAPDACTACHAGRSAAWAAGWTKKWYGGARAAKPHFGLAIAAARDGHPRAARRLLAVAGDKAQPGIVRASTIALLAGQRSRDAYQLLIQALEDADPLVRAAAAGALAQSLRGAALVRLMAPLLDDKVRAVRVAAARAIYAVPSLRIPPGSDKAADKAKRIFLASIADELDWPATHVGLGTLRGIRGEVAAAEAAFRKAIALQPRYVPATINLADLYRATGRDKEAEPLLKSALKLDPAQPDLHHALGLLYARQRKLDDAVRHLRLAVEAAPKNARYAQVLAAAMDATRGTKPAINVLRQAYLRMPRNERILRGLLAYTRRAGDRQSFEFYAARLKALFEEKP